MPSIIKLARGLRALVGGQGENYSPQEIAAVLAPTIDLLQPYLLDNREYISMGVAAAPVLGANRFPAPAVPVPAGELWYVWNYVVVSQPGAGAAIDLVAAIEVDGNPLTNPVGQYKSATAGQEARSYNLEPFWAGPSTWFGFAVGSLTLTPSIFGALVATRLRI